MIDITVKVPDNRVPEFYSMFGSWLSAPPASNHPETSDSKPAAEWTAADRDLAKAVWRKLSDTAKRLFSALIDSPGKKFSGTELSELLQVRNGAHGIAGVLAWPSRYCADNGREIPWSWEYPDDGEPAVYWFTDEIAALFRQAQEQ